MTKTKAIPQKKSFREDSCLFYGFLYSRDQQSCHPYTRKRLFKMRPDFWPWLYTHNQKVPWSFNLTTLALGCTTESAFKSTISWPAVLKILQSRLYSTVQGKRSLIRHICDPDCTKPARILYLWRLDGWKHFCEHIYIIIILDARTLLAIFRGTNTTHSSLLSWTHSNSQPIR